MKVIGLSLPSLCRPYVHAGIILASGRLKAGATSLEAGRVGKVEIRGDQVILGAPFTFTKDNIDSQSSLRE